ncbi:MAG: DUF4367 domain-containing protein [Oscillospiraceae bacterium]|jgi:hypothetical protein|nr:DUF4367 domain-containing protein [Oscillospiraceae bacterium]
MTKGQMTDSVFDAFFRQAVIDNFFKELELITTDDEISSQSSFSAEHDKRMVSMFANEKRKNTFNTTVRWSKRVAAVVFITVSILFGSLMLVPEVSAIVVNTVVEWFEKFARFTSSSTETTKLHLEPIFIPDGFWEEDRYSDDLVTTIIFLNAEGIIIFYEASLVSAQLSIDNEGHEYDVKQVDDNYYHILTAIEVDKENKVVWDADGQRFILASIIPIEELINMALFVG